MIALCSLFISYMKMYCLLVYIDVFSYFIYFCHVSRPSPLLGDRGKPICTRTKPIRPRV